MKKEQRDTVELVQRYLSTLDSHLSEIIGLDGANSGFVDIQNAYVDSLSTCMEKAERRIHEIKHGAVWDNLVIAFFGETNAGKSTIIETFRILFEEEERASRLKQTPEGVDGLIVGDGSSDFTQVYKEYRMRISGVPFTLIDVPGIEGNEAAYEKEIQEALQKAHYVFYVQGQQKKPDSGTAGKIKKYLREWVKVYSIYNVRGEPGVYEEEEERASMLSESDWKIEAQIKDTFQEVLGRTYMGNISIHALMAMCSKASFAANRADLRRRQKKFLSYFGDAYALYRFSQFDSLVETVNQKAKNFTKEIVEANKEKHKAMLMSMCSDLRHVSVNQAGAISSLDSLLDDFQGNVKQDFQVTKSQISSISDRIYDQIFSEISDMAMKTIENDVGDKKKYCERRTKEITDEKARVLQDEISCAIESLNETIKRRKKDLDQSIASTWVNVSNASLSVSPNFDEAIKKLDFNMSDLGSLVVRGAGVYGVFEACIALLGQWGVLIGAIYAIFQFFGGRDRKSEAKDEMRKSIAKAKNENREAFNNQIKQIRQSLENSLKEVVQAVDADRKNLEKLRYLVQKITYSIQIEYSKLNIAEYGTL